MSNQNGTSKVGACIISFLLGFMLGDLIRVTELKSDTRAGYNEEGQELIKCPNNYAIMVKKGYEFAGSYIKCEDFDPFYEALAEERVQDAEKLLLIKR